MTRAELLGAITVYWNSGVERSPEGLTDHIWGNWQQVELLKRHNGGTLTPRMWQVLALVAEGLYDKEIAAQLGTAINTVHHQEATIRKKLGLRGSNRAVMARWYAEHAGTNTAKV